jgi:hypothetical protein
MGEGTPRFRTSFTSQAGNVAAQVVQGKVVGLNLVNWTVDVITQFDRKKYFDIQVGSPYMHYSNGEGMSIFPEIGAKCMVTLPSDSSPPYVSTFIMPVENVDLAAADAEKGTTSHSKPNRSSVGASFAGGRPRVKPGDILFRTRDDNFVILHRGGVLQLGSTELAQRIYIPLNNFIMDVSENYAHHNAGGSILWSVQTGANLDKLPTEYTHSFRVYANDKSADVRVKIGKCTDLMVEPDDGAAGDINQLGMGTKENFIMCEVVVAPGGFNPQSGAQEPGAKSSQVFRFFFDKAGNVLLRAKGSIVLRTAKRLHISADEGIQFKTEAEYSVTAKNGATIDGGAFAHLKGGVVRLGPGAKPVAHLGSMVQVMIPYTPVPIPGSPPLVLFGTVITGAPTVLT